MAVKIEIQTAAKLPSKAEELVNSILSSVPREHVRGLERVRLVGEINDPRLRGAQLKSLPGLYHPRQGSQPAWIEVAVDVLLPSAQPFYKRLLPRLSFKGNLAAVLFSLIGQHYYLTLRHSVKRGQLESSVRTYTEQHLRRWSEQQHGLRTRLFKPLQPTFERWARTLQRRAKATQRK